MEKFPFIFLTKFDGRKWSYASLIILIKICRYKLAPNFFGLAPRFRRNLSTPDILELMIKLKLQEKRKKNAEIFMKFTFLFWQTRLATVMS